MVNGKDLVKEAGQDLTIPAPDRKKMIRKLKAGEARELMKYLVEDPIYLENFQKRMRAGALAPPIEAMVWAYAFGKPKEEITVRKAVAVRIVHEYQVAAGEEVPAVEGEVVPPTPLLEESDDSGD